MKRENTNSKMNVKREKESFCQLHLLQDVKVKAWKTSSCHITCMFTGFVAHKHFNKVYLLHISFQFKTL
jgi:hypothetical protein